MHLFLSEAIFFSGYMYMRMVVTLIQLIIFS